MSDSLEHQPEHMLIDGEAANDLLLDETDSEDEPGGVKINLHENEHDLLDMSDDDPTATLCTMNKGEQVVIWATIIDSLKSLELHCVLFSATLDSVTSPCDTFPYGSTSGEASSS